MIKIDSHHHLWYFDQGRFPWIDNTMEVLRKNYLPEDLVPLLEENGMDGTVVIQAEDSENETVFLLDTAAGNEFIKGVSGWVDLTADNAEERLENFSENSLFKGVRHIVQDEPDDFLFREDFQRGVSKLQRFGLTYDILVYQRQLKAAVKLVRNFPDQKFVLNHIGKPKTKKTIDADWEKDMVELSKSQNVFCKLSGSVWSNKDYYQVADIVISAFGTDRVMYGSDWPVCLLETNYSESILNAREYISSFSIDEQEKILGGNAINFYNL